MKNSFNFYSLFLLLILLLFTCLYEKPYINTGAIANENNEKQVNKYFDIEPYIEEHNEFWGSNSQMLYWANETLKSLYKRYEKLYSNLVTIYAEDTDFVKALKTDRKAFEEYRNTQKKLGYPRTETCDTMKEYSDWSSDYILTVQHIEGLKKKIYLYCSSHSSLLKNKNICKEEKIDELFNNVKLKEPKPIISTPYDKEP